jgi:hypothetical protein
MVLKDPGMIVNIDEDLPGFNFQVVNDSRLTTPAAPGLHPGG